MRALTIRQPWASLIAQGVKTIETRSWKAPAAAIGERVAIHAGAKVPAEGMDVGRWTVERWRDDPARPCMVGGGDWRTPGSVVNPIDLPLGAVVATAVLTDCVPMVPVNICTEGPHLTVYSTALGLCQGSTVVGGVDDVTDQLPFGDFAPRRWAWLLDDVKPTTERCPTCWGGWVAFDLDGGRATGCATCGTTNGCEPVPARGKQGLWRWTP